jgi:hypothetical protein
LERNPGSEEGGLPRPPPAPEALARQVLAIEAAAHQRADDMPAAAGLAYDRLRARLSVFLGEVGFDALWARALALTRRSFPPADAAAEEHAAALPPGLATVIAGRNAVEAATMLQTVFANFFTLLFSFIGSEISLRLIRQLWPDLPRDAADMSGERGKL